MEAEVRRSLEMSGSANLSQIKPLVFDRNTHMKRKMRLRCDTRELAIGLFHRIDHASRLFRESQNKCTYFGMREALVFEHADA